MINVLKYGSGRTRGFGLALHREMVIIVDADATDCHVDQMKFAGGGLIWRQSSQTAPPTPTCSRIFLISRVEYINIRLDFSPMKRSNIPTDTNFALDGGVCLSF